MSINNMEDVDSEFFQRLYKNSLSEPPNTNEPNATKTHIKIYYPIEIHVLNYLL